MNTDIAVIDSNDNNVVEVIDASNGALLRDDFYACFKNDLVKARQTTTLREAKLLRIIISQVVEDATDFKTFKVKAADLAELLELKSSSIYRDAKKICESLHTKYISIQNEDGTWENFNWICHSYYDNAYIHITLSDQLKPYLLNLDANFTKVKVKEIIKFNSFYGLRIYEMLKSEWDRRYHNVNNFKYKVAYLRQILDGEKKLKTFSHFKERVLVPAVDSINNNPYALFSVSIKYDTGYKRAVEYVTFTISPRNDNSNALETIL